MALTGTTRGSVLAGALALALFGAGCGSSSHTNDPGGDTDATRDGATDSTRDDGAAGGACAAASDCTLISKGCCGACEPSKEVVRAVLTSERDAQAEAECPGPDPACGPCEIKPYDALAPELRADCRNAECVVVDLREEAVTACTRDEDCQLVEIGCCGSCGRDPSGWAALQDGKVDELAPICDPIPPCLPCDDAQKPAAFCADDGHCAVKAIEAVAGVPSTTCVSPQQNLELAYEGGVGCDCFTAGAGLCVANANGGLVALICREEDLRWAAVEDGPCWP